MSSESRYRSTIGQRRHRAAASGVGIAVGGAMAATFISMGTAAAVPIDTEPDPLSIGAVAAVPVDTDPDPFADLLGPTASATELANAQTLDDALILGAPSYAEEFDELIDQYGPNYYPGNQLPPPPGDDDPFEDLLPKNPFLAADFDNQLYNADPSLAASLDAQVDALLADNDALTDLTQAFGSVGGAFIAAFDQLITGAPITDSVADSLIASLGLGPF